MNSTTRAVTVLGLLVSLLPATAGAADNASLAAAVDRAMRPLLQEHDAPGLAVALTVDGRRHFFSYGVASRQTKALVTQDTLFEIGSLSKVFTATLASYAQVIGKLSLDDTPGTHMPALASSAIDAVRLLHLGTYTAGGLPLQFPATITGNGLMAAYFRQWKPAAAPGTQRRYSNPSIGLLGHITGLAMNGNFSDLLESELFPRLGLNHSHIRVPETAMDDYAWGYDRTNKPVRVTPGVLDAEAYGVKSTAADMIRFVELNLRPERLAAPLRRAIEGTHVGYFRVGDMVQGLGWEQYRYPITLDRLLAGNSPAMSQEANAATAIEPPLSPSGPTLFNKTGSTNGFGGYVAFIPERKVGIVILANRNVPIPARIVAARAVLDSVR